MLDLGGDERTTLEVLSWPGDDVVFDGSTLSKLREKGLVAMSTDGWSVTPLGQCVLRDLGAHY